MIDAVALGFLVVSGAVCAALSLRRSIVLGILVLPAFMVGWLLWRASEIRLESSVVHSPISLMASVIPAAVVFVFVWLLVNLRFESRRTASVLASVLYRIPCTAAFVVMAAALLLQLVKRDTVSLTRHGASPVIVLIVSLSVASAVGANLLFRWLWRWRENEPGWFGAIGGRTAAAALGFSYALQLLAIILPSLVSFRFFMTDPVMPGVEGESSADRLLSFSAPSEFGRAVAKSRLAYHFLDPTDEGQARLLSERVPRYGARVCKGLLPGGTIAYYEPCWNQVWRDQQSPPAVVDAATARLVPGNPDYLAVLDSSGFEIFGLSDTTWNSCAVMPFVNAYAQLERGRTAWCTGDLDGDGLDEIIAGDSSRIVLLSWRGASFERRELGFPHLVDNLIVGDIDGDGRNELVISASDEKLRDGLVREQIWVERLGPRGLETVWTDHGMLGVGDNRVSAPDQLLAIADVENRGMNSLLIWRSSRDLRHVPGSYLVLGWHEERLTIDRSFSIINGEMATRGRATALRNADMIGTDVEGPLAVGVLNARTVCLGTMLSGSAANWAAILQIGQDRISTVGRIPAGRGDYRTFFQLLLINPDGKGTSVLQIFPVRWGRRDSRYALDRLAPAPDSEEASTPGRPLGP